jgi:hypothetical protein
MNALLALNPDDVARFTGRHSRPFEALPNIEVSLVTLIKRSGREEAWRELWVLITTDRLPPNFRRRVAGCQTQNCRCNSCGSAIETADQIALVMQRGREFGMLCADCGALPRDVLVAKLSPAGVVEPDATFFVKNAPKAEFAIALCCGLDPTVDLDWSIDDEWDYELGAPRSRQADA